MTIVRLLFLMNLLFVFNASTQVVVSFQSGETTDPWTYISSGASAIALNEAQLAPNKTSGTRSLVAGGNTGGGNCFAGGSGNGPSTARSFTFDPLDISQSNESTRTLTFNWGNRFPACNGTGWDSGENLTFTPYLDGVAQPTVTLVTGSNNAQFSIQTHQHTYSIPPCVNSFHFRISVTTNRSDEYLFIDDVQLTAPQLNGSGATPIAGPVYVCEGSIESYTVNPVPSLSYTWSGLPSGAQFTSANGTTSSSTMEIDWGTAAPGTYTISVITTNACGTEGTPQTLDVTVEPAPLPVNISGPATICSGQSVELQTNYTSNITWSTNETTPSIFISTPGTYSISINTACGLLTADHTVAPGELPLIQSVDVSPISCNGQDDGALLVTASASGALSYAINGGTWQASPIFSNLPAGDYVVSVQTDQGCTSQQTVTIQDLPPLEVTASNDGAVCEGTIIGLHATSNYTGAVGYSWSGPNGYTSDLSDPIDALESGTYTVIASYGACTSAPDQTVATVYAIPVANATNSGPYCAGEVIVLNGSVDLGNPATYSWSGPNGFSSMQQNPLTAIEAGNYELTVTVDGCSSLPAVTTVNLFPIPDALADYSAPFCPGTVLNLFGASSLSGVTYSWFGPNGYSSSEQNPSDATEAGTYTLTTSANGCISSPFELVVVPESPSLQVFNSGPACEGTLIQLSSATDATENLNYFWTGPNGFTSSLPNPSGVSISGTYQLTLTAGTCTVQSATEVLIHPNPIADFYEQSDCIYSPLAFNSLSYVPDYPNAIESWTWDFGDGTTGFGETTDHTYPTAGAYTAQLTVQSIHGCSASAQRIMNVWPKPNAQFSFYPEELSDFNPTVVFHNTTTNADSYSWIIDEQTFDLFEPEYTFENPSSAQTVTLIAYSDQGCIDTIEQIIPYRNELIYYVPNAFTPDGDEFNNTFNPVFSSGHDPYHYLLSIYNRWGELIFQTQDLAIGWDGTYNGRTVENGTYSWVIEVKFQESDDKASLVGHVSLIR